MKVGFTGTQSGMTKAQKLSFLTLLKRIKPAELHHGDCVGADADAHDLTRELLPQTKVTGHIPLDDYKRAFKKCDEEREPLPYLERNEKIARECDLIIAAPKEDEETLRSGTWATIRRARKTRTNILIIWPNGTIKKETFIKAGEGLPIEEA